MVKKYEKEIKNIEDFESEMEIVEGMISNLFRNLDNIKEINPRHILKALKMRDSVTRDLRNFVTKLMRKKKTLDRELKEKKNKDFKRTEEESKKRRESWKKI